MKNYFNKKITLYILVILVAGITTTAFAFEKIKMNISSQNDFVVEPGKTEIFLNPGESIVKNITITNRIGKTMKFKLTTEDLKGTDNSQQPVVLMGDEEGPYSLKNFIQPEINEFSLETGEKIIVPVKISVPIDAEPRGHYGALIVSNEPEVMSDGKSSDAQGKAHIISRIGSLFLLRINGEGKEEGSLQDFKIIGPRKYFYEKNPQGFEIAFKNSGNVHLVPYGKVTIKNLFGRNVGEIPVDAYFALPDSVRYREILWGDSGFSVGRYTANLSLYQGYGNEYDESKIAFWIIPWKILLAVFFGLVIFVSLIYYILTRFEIKKK